MFLGNVVIEVNFLDRTDITSRLRANPGPFFCFRLSSQKVVNRYWLEEGDVAKHLVKSDLLPYPSPAPEVFLASRSPAYELSGHLRGW